MQKGILVVLSAVVLFWAFAALAGDPAGKAGGSAQVGEDKPAAKDAAEGVWKSIDDNDNQPRSLVKIWVHNGVMYGKITKIYRRPSDPAEMKCDKCEGSNKNQPVEGLLILWGMKKDGDEWSGGYILDPESGDTYKCIIEVEDGGKKLKVRGYLGVSALGRTQYWLRVE